MSDIDNSDDDDRHLNSDSDFSDDDFSDEDNNDFFANPEPFEDEQYVIDHPHLFIAGVDYGLKIEIEDIIIPEGVTTLRYCQFSGCMESDPKTQYFHIIHHQMV